MKDVLHGKSRKCIYRWTWFKKYLIATFFLIHIYPHFEMKIRQFPPTVMLQMERKIWIFKRKSVGRKYCAVDVSIVPKVFLIDFMYIGWLYVNTRRVDMLVLYVHVVGISACILVYATHHRHQATDKFSTRPNTVSHFTVNFRV